MRETSWIRGHRRAGWLVLAALLAHANSVRGVFHFDDAAILEDSRLDSLSSYFAHLGGMIRPALKLSFLLDRAFWGETPAGYHLLNFSLHVASGLLFYALVARLVRGSTPERDTASSRQVALVAALLFLVHPIATETVAYISARATGLMACFYLAGVYAYLRATDGPRPLETRAGTWPHLAAVGCFALSLLSKETALTFPLALLLVDSVARRRSAVELRDAVRRFHLPFWAVCVAFLLAASFNPRYVYLARISREIRPVYENILAQVDVVPYALSLFVLPGRLNIDHDIAPAASIFSWPTPLSFLVLLGLVILAILLRRRAPLAAFGLCWFLLQLLPTNSVIARYDLLSERNLYLAAPGLFLTVAWTWRSAMARLDEAARRSPAARIMTAAVRTVAVAIVSLLVLATISRNALYAEPIELWSDAARKSPNKARPHVNLGHAYFLAGDVERAVVETRRGLALDRDNPVAQANLRALWQRQIDAK